MQDSYYLQLQGAYGASEPIAVGAHLLPGRSRDYDAEKVWQREAVARWGNALHGWDIQAPRYGYDFTLTPPNHASWHTDMDARAELAAELEDVAGEEGLRMNAMALADWIVRPLISKLTYPRSEAELIERHLLLAEARNPHLESYFEGRYPVRCGDFVREFYAELNVFEVKVVRLLINRCSKRRPYPTAVRIGGYITDQTITTAVHSLAAKGWAVIKGVQFGNLPTAMRAGKSMAFSERLLLAE